jgi:Rrf2 family protein
MRISTKGRYSLEALLYMALLPNSAAVSARTVSQNTGISDGYLEQLFIPLRRAGIVQSIKGQFGGYVLGRAFEHISVGQILRAAEGSLEPVDCVISKPCPARSSCMPRHTWSKLYKEINACVDSITLADLVKAYHAMDKMEYAI